MGDSETLRLLKSGKVVGLELCLLESIVTLPENAGQEVQYMIKYSTISPTFQSEEVLYLVSPDKIGNGHPVHETYNLNLFANDNIESCLPATEQLSVMVKFLEKIARIDPRIKDSKATPIATIEKIGGRQFELKFWQDCYSFVQKEIHESFYR